MRCSISSTEGCCGFIFVSSASRSCFNCASASLASVAIHPADDASSLHVRAADEAHSAIAHLEPVESSAAELSEARAEMERVTGGILPLAKEVAA